MARLVRATHDLRVARRLGGAARVSVVAEIMDHPDKPGDDDPEGDD
jgi:hypothetical protein